MEDTEWVHRGYEGRKGGEGLGQPAKEGGGCGYRLSFCPSVLIEEVEAEELEEPRGEAVAKRHRDPEKGSMDTQGRPRRRSSQTDQTRDGGGQRKPQQGWVTGEAKAKDWIMLWTPGQIPSRGCRADQGDEGEPGRQTQDQATPWLCGCRDAHLLGIPRHPGTRWSLEAADGGITRTGPSSSCPPRLSTPLFSASSFPLLLRMGWKRAARTASPITLNHPCRRSVSRPKPALRYSDELHPLSCWGSNSARNILPPLPPFCERICSFIYK